MVFYFLAVRPWVKDVRKIACIELAGARKVNMSDVNSITCLMTRKAMPVRGITFKHEKAGNRTSAKLDPYEPIGVDETLAETLARMLPGENLKESIERRRFSTGKIPRKAQPPPKNRGKLPFHRPFNRKKRNPRVTRSIDHESAVRHTETEAVAAPCQLFHKEKDLTIDTRISKDHVQTDLPPPADQEQLPKITREMVESKIQRIREELSPIQEEDLESFKKNPGIKFKTNTVASDDFSCHSSPGEKLRHLIHEKLHPHPSSSRALQHLAQDDDHHLQHDQSYSTLDPKSHHSSCTDTSLDQTTRHAKRKSCMKVATLEESLKRCINKCLRPADHDAAPHAPKRQNSPVLLEVSDSSSSSNAEDSDSTVSFVFKNIQQLPRLKWGKVEVREYSQCLGDNPACSDGPPIQLNWDYELLGFAHLDDYERHRRHDRCCDANSLRLPGTYRRHLLMLAGHTSKEIIQAVREKSRNQKRRVQTVERLNSMTLDEKIECLLRAFPGKKSIANNGVEVLC